ncbi:hypothetical protein B4U80_12440, partial [Leptotrombidium deliense]
MEHFYPRTKKGLLIIIDQRFTKKGKIPNSNEEDIEKIRHTFQSLGYQIHNIYDFKNLQAHQLVKKFKSTVLKYHLEKDSFGRHLYDCLVVVVLSFAFENNYIAASDGDFIIDKLYEIVENYFVDIPKIFIFRTPNIKEKTNGIAEVVFEVSEDDDDIRNNEETCVYIPDKPDHLVIINSHPLQKDLNSESGWRSDFIDNLTKLINAASVNEKRCNVHILSLLIQLNSHLAQKEPFDQEYGMMPLHCTFSTLKK